METKQTWKQQLYLIQRCVALKSAVHNYFKDVNADYTDLIDFVHILKQNFPDEEFLNTFYDEVSNIRINQRIDLGKINSHVRRIKSYCMLDILLGFLTNKTLHLENDIRYEKTMNNTKRIIILDNEVNLLKKTNKCLCDELDFYKEPNIS